MADSFLKAFEKILDEVIGPGSSDLPSENENYDPTFSNSDAQTSYSPDASKQFMQDQGYAQPPIVSPFELPPDQVRSVITDRPSPFSVIDIDTVALEYQGSGIAGPVQENFSADSSLQIAQSTLNKLTQYFNSALTSSSPTILAPNQNEIQTFARTVVVSSPANFLRAERLPAGNTTAQFINQGGGVTGPAKSSLQADAVTSYQANVDLISGVTSGAQAIPDGYLLQALAARFFSGLFIQFDSTDNPIFKVKDFEEYRLPFQTVYITFFINDLKWRVITGQKAAITGGDARAIKQNLHIWDGPGLIDQNIYTPTPFSTFDELDVATGLAGIAHSLVSNYDAGSLITPVATNTTTKQCTTFTYPSVASANPLIVTLASGNTTGIVIGANVSGTGIAGGTYVQSIIDSTHFMLSQPASSAVTNQTFTFSNVTGGSGLTTNKGYGVLWITGFNIDFIKQGTNNPSIDFEISKGFYDSTLVGVNKFVTTQIFVYRRFILSTSAVFPQNLTVDFQIPIRVTLAGFDAQSRKFGTSTQTGEVLFARAQQNSAVTGGPISLCLSMRGYALGWVTQSPVIPLVSTIACLPFNPYPVDCLNSFPPAPT